MAADAIAAFQSGKIAQCIDRQVLDPVAQLPAGQRSRLCTTLRPSRLRDLTVDGATTYGIVARVTGFGERSMAA
jgi:hypothetical protein